MLKYHNNNKHKYWNSFVTTSRDQSLNHDIINEIEQNCQYEILHIGNEGKIKKNKRIDVKNRELYTRFKLNQEIPYLKKYKHLISVNPPGKKYLLYIKNFSNKNQVIFINRYKDKNLNYEHQVLKVDMNFKETLFKGTLLDGQAVKKKDGKWYFVIDDIYMYEGYNIMNNSFLDRLELLKNFFKNDYFERITNPYIDVFKNNSNDVIYFEIKLYLEYKYALDLCTNYYRFLNYQDNNEKFKNKNYYEDGYNGDIPKGLIFTNININATKIHFVLPIDDFNNSIKDNHYDNSTNNSLNINSNCNKDSETLDTNFAYFKMRKTKISDIYNMYCLKNDLLINYGNPSINKLSQSEKINSCFKKRKIDFNNTITNFEDDEIITKCVYNSKFNKWEPMEVEEHVISNEDDIKRIEQEHLINHSDTQENIKKYSKPEYNKQNYLLYNEHNILLNIKFIENILNTYGLEHSIKNKDIFQTAFVHKSYSKNYYIKEYNKDKSGKNLISSKVAYHLITNNVKDFNGDCIDLFEISNERLEWFGDAKLADIISTYLENRYPNEDEGFLTLIRSKLVKKNTLYELGKKLNFQKYIIMSKDIEYYENGRDSQDIIEDCFEAFIGALYKELSQNKCEYKLKQFIINLYEKEIDFVEIISNDDNYKAQLMEYYHRLHKKNPIYKTTEEISNDGSEKIFNVKVCEPINRTTIGYGDDKVKKKAEQKAAKNALIHLQII